MGLDGKGRLHVLLYFNIYNQNGSISLLFLCRCYAHNHTICRRFATLMLFFAVFFVYLFPENYFVTCMTCNEKKNIYKPFRLILKKELRWAKSLLSIALH